MNHRNFSVIILFKADALYKICVHKPDLISGEKSEIFLRRLLHEVLSFYIEFPSKGYLPFSKLRIVRVKHPLNHLSLSFGIIVYNKLHRIEDSHDALVLILQILPDAVLKQRILGSGICFRDT